MELVFLVVAVAVVVFMLFLIKNASAHTFINRIVPMPRRCPQQPPVLDEGGTDAAPSAANTQADGIQTPRFAYQVLGYNREQVDDLFRELLAERAQFVRKISGREASDRGVGESEQ